MFQAPPPKEPKKKFTACLSFWPANLGCTQ